MRCSVCFFQCGLQPVFWPWRNLTVTCGWQLCQSATTALKYMLNSFGATVHPCVRPFLTLKLAVAVLPSLTSVCISSWSDLMICSIAGDTPHFCRTCHRVCLDTYSYAFWRSINRINRMSLTHQFSRSTVWQQRSFQYSFYLFEIYTDTLVEQRQWPVLSPAQFWQRLSPLQVGG